MIKEEQLKFGRELGDNIRNYRRLRNMTQAQLAEAAKCSPESMRITKQSKIPVYAGNQTLPAY